MHTHDAAVDMNAAHAAGVVRAVVVAKVPALLCRLRAAKIVDWGGAGCPGSNVGIALRQGLIALDRSGFGSLCAQPSPVREHISQWQRGFP